MRRIILSLAALLIAGHAFAQKTVYHDAAGLTVIGKAMAPGRELCRLYLPARNCDV